MTYLYHWGAAQNWGNKKTDVRRYLPYTWNDFCRKTHKQHNMVYPTADGVVDTLQWEGYREGVDDVRYVTTLVDMVKKNKTSRQKNVRESVRKAESFLAELKKGDINVSGMNMDIVRLRIIDHILDILKSKVEK
jgi:hypothetical protein